MHNYIIKVYIYIYLFIYREFGKSLCTRLQSIVIAHARLMN